jgi:hypothetical protein
LVQSENKLEEKKDIKNEDKVQEFRKNEINSLKKIISQKSLKNEIKEKDEINIEKEKEKNIIEKDKETEKTKENIKSSEIKFLQDEKCKLINYTNILRELIKKINKTNDNLITKYLDQQKILSESKTLNKIEELQIELINDTHINLKQIQNESQLYKNRLVNLRLDISQTYSIYDFYFIEEVINKKSIFQSTHLYDDKILKKSKSLEQINEKMSSLITNGNCMVCEKSVVFKTLPCSHGFCKGKNFIKKRLFGCDLYIFQNLSCM